MLGDLVAKRLVVIEVVLAIKLRGRRLWSGPFAHSPSKGGRQPLGTSSRAHKNAEGGRGGTHDSAIER